MLELSSVPIRGRSSVDSLTLQKIVQKEDFVSPLQASPGFTEHWWDLANTRRVNDEYSIYYQLLRNGEEIGRAEVLGNNTLEGPYQGVDCPLGVNEISFFEIREDFRREGYGRKFAEFLKKAYPDQILAAFSEEADDFWGNIGWFYCPREEGDTRFYRKLFLSQAV